MHPSVARQRPFLQYYGRGLLCRMVTGAPSRDDIPAVVVKEPCPFGLPGFESSSCARSITTNDSRGL